MKSAKFKYYFVVLIAGVLLMNNKGQAFSVFELMIAGVVAFAILIILLMVIGGVGIGNYSDAKKVLGDAVKTAAPSGPATSQNFALRKDEPITTSDLAVTTELDAKSMFFNYGQFDESKDSLAIGSDGDSVVYTGATQKRLAAKILCAQTAEDLVKKFDLLSSSSAQYKLDDPTSKCEQMQPCCGIILIRPVQ
jgi:hypothetical protein